MFYKKTIQICYFKYKLHKFIFKILGFNCRTLCLITKNNVWKIFIKIGYIDWKIKVFEVK
jgi:hypothetical protein